MRVHLVYVYVNSGIRIYVDINHIKPACKKLHFGIGACASMLPALIHASTCTNA
jgi:hypothetical protein